MRTLATLATTTLLLLFLAAAPAFPQDDAKPEAKSSQQEEKNKDKDKDKDLGKEKQKDNKNDKVAKPDERPNDERKGNNENRQDERQKQDEHRMPAASQSQEQRPDHDMNRGQQHQAQRGKRIPDDKFRSSFGRQHTFHVRREQVVNAAQPVVVFGGYSFQLVDAWPVDWGFDDDVYIDYVDDGYYLFDPLHPGIRIAVFVVE